MTYTYSVEEESTDTSEYDGTNTLVPSRSEKLNAIGIISYAFEKLMLTDEELRNEISFISNIVMNISERNDMFIVEFLNNFVESDL